ncbi:glutaredoxin [Streptomyces sp. BK208]|uniref:glutaredoxin domain-containing protein n=1 Tax=Streptomyces sp. BK208 TaxID=2512150 RepID=UPI001060FC99|nr:glutaredoxin domain-containing protein [Streptomyces sp. BK208]TDT40646.1 glutaredoxin [Streptomyces sp. BK208]
MRRAWTNPVLLLIAGAGAATGPFVQGRPGTGTVMVVLFVVLAAMTSPLLFPRPIGALEARRRSAVDGRPVVFWRPGCTYCMRLRIRLGRKARRLYWVDIWRDEAGAELVREANDGNETVPTLFVAGRPYTNPDPAWVREQVSSSR